MGPSKLLHRSFLLPLIWLVTQLCDAKPVVGTGSQNGSSGWTEADNQGATKESFLSNLVMNMTVPELGTILSRF